VRVPRLHPRWPLGTGVTAPAANRRRPRRSAPAPAAPAAQPPPPTDEERELLRKIFEENRQCAHCGGFHHRACPRVRSFTFHSNGDLASVEFWPDGRWSDEHVVWREQVAPPPTNPNSVKAGERGT
jgi:hypothetical protein